MAVGDRKGNGGLMRFVVDDGFRSRGVVHLIRSAWDDWFKFATLFQVVYVDDDGAHHEIGGVKIGEFGLEGITAGEFRGQKGFRSPTLKARFSKLGAEQFSVGQDTSYYENLTAISAQFRREYLQAMNDLARYQPLLKRAAAERVTQVSLLRDVPLQTVRNQFARLAVGKPRLTSYDFKFVVDPNAAEPCRLSFEVQPHSQPPTNIHVLIGRNGVGKSTTLNAIATSIVEKSLHPDEDPWAPAEDDQWRQLSNVVSVSFSAFDAFVPIRESQDRTNGLTYHYVGLRKKGSKVDPDSPALETKNLAALSRELSLAAKHCLVGARRGRWRKALTLLEGDPIFASLGLVAMIDGAADDREFLDELPNVVKRLSSGHKIVLLTITKLVETVVEKSLVLLDEPESHLHPPLLSAFTRALSDLLTDRNGLAIMATHSPVVLQEVPRSCVWRLQRVGWDVTAERLAIETFGENVGTLTNEVFGLEVVTTGFHTMLTEIVSETPDYDTAVAKLGGQLGSEGRAILRAMINARMQARSVGS